MSTYSPDARTLKKLQGIRPELADKVLLVLSVMATLGFPMTVTDGNRTEEEQRALYAKGRTAPGEIVTNTDGVIKKSNHQGGRAVDCTFLDEDGDPFWPDYGKWIQAWAAYGACAKALGLVWGGDWTSLKDKPHVELPKGS